MGAACTGFAGLIVALVTVAAAAAHVLVPHALQPIAHKAMAIQPLSGLAALVFALGAPLRWQVGAGARGANVNGTLRAGGLVGAHPLILVGPVLVAVAVFLAGFLAARHAVRTGHSAARAAAGAAAGFTALSTVAALAVSRATVTFGTGLTAHVHVDAASVFLLSAAWGAVGVAAGWALAVHRLPSVTHAIASWRVRLVGPASGLAVSGLLLTALISPGATPAASATAAPTTSSSAPSTTVTTTAPTSSTTEAAAAQASAGGTAASSGRRAASSRSTTSTTGRSAASTTSSTAPATTHTSALSFDPPAAGTYSYTTSGSASWGLGKTIFPSTSTLVVDPAVNGRQHSRRQILTVAGEGLVIDQWLEYRASGIRVATQQITTSFNKSTTVRELKAATTQLYLSPTPAPGEHHEFDLTNPTVSAHEIVDMLRTETLTIAGQSVNASVVRTVIKLGGAVSGTLEFDQWFDMSRRMVVKEQNTASVGASIVHLTSNYAATLQRLTPA